MKSPVNFKDLTNKTFGRLTVVERDIHSVGRVYWFCKCSCGNIKRVRGTHLNAGKINSCGCLLHERSSQFLDIKGMTFGYATVVDVYSKSRPIKWICKCKCGNTFITQGNKLRSGRCKSCGCYRTDLLKITKRTHGMTIDNKRLYNIWNAMNNRCYNIKHDKYKYYGGRGITICDEWLDNNSLFFDWALANGYKNPLTIHRKDNDGNYSAGNCCFITHQEQMQATSVSTPVPLVILIKKDIINTTLTLKEVSKKFNVKYDIVLDIKNERTYKNIKVN